VAFDRVRSVVAHPQSEAAPTGEIGANPRPRLYCRLVSDRPRDRSLGELAWLFFRLGTTAFGGPAAHIAMMEEEVVRRREWLTRDQFLDYLGATNLIPGPNSTELAIHVGYARRGWPGLLVAGACFILPAALIVTAIAWAYVTFGSMPRVTGVLEGVKPVVIAIVGQALWQLGRTAVKSAALAVLAACSVAAIAAGLHELMVLLAAGLLSALAGAALRPRGHAIGGAVIVAGVSAGSVTVSAFGAATATFSHWTLFLVFAKIGSVLFGSGYVLLAFLRADFVERLGWLTDTQLLDAIAVGQVTPGPVFTTATFVGYLLGGVPGAAVATVGIFLPAFVFVALSAPLVPRLRQSPFAGAVLDGVNVASLALMVVVTWQLARATLVSPAPLIVAVASLIALVHFRISSTWLIAAGAVLGMIW
jgi:chromate transporter